ncbi:MAG: ATP-binding protein [Bacteroidia bacterium]|jgi:PAS domain S-box-containing protein|nr:ATP-binding protein [Bacteroidia bacterium]
MLDRTALLKGFNLWAIIVCLFFFSFLSVFVDYSEHYWFFLVASAVFALNHLFIKRHWHTFSFFVFVVASNGLLFTFDGGLFSPTIGFIFYIPLLLCNIVLSDVTQKWQGILAGVITLASIYLTSFTSLTPRFADLLFVREHQIVIASFNMIMATSMSLLITYLLINSWHKTKTQLELGQSVNERNQRLLSSINQNISIGICRTQASTNKIVYANRANVELFGYTDEEELLSMEPSSLYVNPEIRAEIIQELETKGEVKNKEVAFKKKNGTHFWAMLSSNRLVDPDLGVVYDGSIRDISAFKIIQHELIHAKEMAEEASLAKSKFLSAMSHEIRTPMNAVIGITNLMLDNPNGNQQAYLALLKNSAHNLLSLLDDLLDFGKIEAGKVDLHPRYAMLKQDLQNIAEMHRPMAEQKKIALKINLEIPNVSYWTDSVRLQQVIVNLLSNAIKFTHSGSVLIEAKILQQTPGEAHVLFQVVDTGIGIHQNHHETIFNAFTQAHSTLEHHYGGSGLGLAICRRIIHAMGSQMTVSSVENKGSTFSFVLNLPYREQSALTESSPAGSHSQLVKGMKVLLAEDNSINVLVAKKTLEKWGAEVTVANNGAEVVSIASDNVFDAILMDLHMPVMDGLQATIALRKKGIQTPIIALTADAIQETKQKTERLGITDYLTKPFDPNELFARLKNIHEHQVA